MHVYNFRIYLLYIQPRLKTQLSSVIFFHYVGLKLSNTTRI